MSDTTKPQPVAYEFLHSNGHAIVDYSEHTHVGPLTADKGYRKLPLIYAEPRNKEEAKAMIIAGMRALGMDL
jgi:hypothetical protein